jgi:hypothetical protein
LIDVFWADREVDLPPPRLGDASITGRSAGAVSVSERSPCESGASPSIDGLRDEPVSALDGKRLDWFSLPLPEGVTGLLYCGDFCRSSHNLTAAFMRRLVLSNSP